MLINKKLGQYNVLKNHFNLFYNINNIIMQTHALYIIYYILITELLSYWHIYFIVFCWIQLLKKSYIYDMYKLIFYTHMD